MPLTDRGYLYLLAVNLGTCVIPLAIFYQQSASINKGLNRAYLAAARVETLVGAVLCQTITAAIVIAAAAAFAHGAAAWAFGEMLGLRHSLSESPQQALWFYRAFAAVLISGGALGASGVNLIRLSIAVGVLNTLLVPILLSFLYHLARRQLPAELRWRGAYVLAVAMVFTVISCVGFYAGVAGAL